MNKDLIKEEQFYSNKEFKFSYSSLNKLLFSPSLFYKDYILNDREIRTDKHLVEGKLVHCLVFEPENLTKKFKIVPDQTPTDSVRNILHKLHEKYGKIHADLMSVEIQPAILEILTNENLYQSLKEDSARLIKVQTEQSKIYWEFINDSNIDVIDQDTLYKCKEQAENIKSNKDVMSIFEEVQTDFELDPIETYAERYLTSDLSKMPFGLHGYVDYYKINHTDKLVTICDLKTTSKSISDFKETVDFYNYWLQAAIYCKLVYANLSKEVDDVDSYEILFKFVVVDKYNQVYPFDVSEETLNNWAMSLANVIKAAEYHYNERNYLLPYEFLVGSIKL